MKSSAMTIGEIASRFGLATHMLRHWESVGLLTPHRVAGGRRRYGSADLYRVASILRGKEAGFPLEDIRDMLEARSVAARRLVLRRHHTALTDRLTRARHALTMIEGGLTCEHDDIMNCPNFQALLRETMGDLPDAAEAVTGQAEAMTESRAAEATALGELGAVFRDAELPEVTVRIPHALAERAVAAWQREDTDPVPSPEPPGDRQTRHQAGTLALIGLAIKERGQTEPDTVAVPLPIELIGVAIDAADKH